MERLHYLLPYADYAHLPPAVSDYMTDTTYADWLIKIFDAWLKDNSSNIKPRIFIDIIQDLYLARENRLHLKPVNSCDDPMFNNNASVITIHTDGEVQEGDMFVANYPYAGRYGKKGFFLQNNTFVSIMNSNEFFEKRALFTNTPSASCVVCKWQNICRGGLVGHRYNPENEYANPSIYCSNIKKLLQHIEKKVFG